MRGSEAIVLPVQQLHRDSPDVCSACLAVFWTGGTAWREGAGATSVFGCSLLRHTRFLLAQHCYGSAGRARPVCKQVASHVSAVHPSHTASLTKLSEKVNLPVERRLHTKEYCRCQSVWLSRALMHKDGALDGRVALIDLAHAQVARLAGVLQVQLPRRSSGSGGASQHAGICNTTYVQTHKGTYQGRLAAAGTRCASPACQVT